MKKFEIREAWLEAAVVRMTPHFKKAGYEVPKIRVSCGWPIAGGRSSSGKRVIGQCWSGEAASDGRCQIFISPWLTNAEAEDKDGAGVLPTLVHEVVHAVVGIKELHNKVFGKCARAVGLEGKLTATHAGEALMKLCEQWTEMLGAYPHAKLDPDGSPVKKQTTRMVKMECKADECGYICRTARKWITDVGPVSCPKHGEMSYEPFETPDEGEEADD